MSETVLAILCHVIRGEVIVKVRKIINFKNPQKNSTEKGHASLQTSKELLRDV